MRTLGKNLFKSFVLFCGVLFMTGCAKHSVNYIPPDNSYKIESNKIYNSPYNIVWKATVDGLAHSFWTLDNIEKESGIITLSFSVSDYPEEYVDCGQWQNYFWDLAQTQDVTFLAAQGGQCLKMLDSYGRFHPIVNRVTQLQGKSNVLVKKIDSNRTEVSVSTKYVFTQNLNSLGAHGIGYLPPISENTIISFTTDDPGKRPPSRMICRSKKTLEAAILELIEKKIIQK